MITIDKVSFRYGDQPDSLTDFSLTVRPGECVLLCGESGCGKTTVTKLINGLIPHFTEKCRLTGRAEVNGDLVGETELYQLAKEIGSVFQNPKSQFFNLDTDSELAFGLENEGRDPEEMKQRLRQTVEELEIKGLMNRDIFSLSGGEKQTLAFASVYAMEPSVYVLDEPTANLDEHAIERLRKQIQLLKAKGHTILIAEHRLYFLADLIDRAVYIKDGRLAQSLTGVEFRTLSQEKRIEMGLRSIAPSSLTLPEAERENRREGLRVEGLTCGYKKEKAVFENLSFTALPGEVLAIVGDNGTGKTTLTRCLCGLLKEREGTVSLDGTPLNRKARRRKSFCVMQDVNHQLFYDSVYGECQQAAAGERQDIEAVLNRFDLLPFREKHPMALSGGQKQRLAAATALLSKKRVLIYDEPTSGLDYRHMREVCSVVRDLAKQGHVILIVSHDKEFMRHACHRVLRLG